MEWQFGERGQYTLWLVDACGEGGGRNVGPGKGCKLVFQRDKSVDLKTVHCRLDTFHSGLCLVRLPYPVASCDSYSKHTPAPTAETHQSCPVAFACLWIQP